MFYSKEFRDLVNSFQNYYIGIGNPKAKILIIGKECGIDTSKATGQDQCELEINTNHRLWSENIKNNADFNDITTWFCENPVYNPIYPYKGQKLSKNPSKGGTSSTWYWYQVLLNLIIGEKENTINFHENCFITELSEVCGKYSKDTIKKEKEQSIQKRTELFKADFFQHFPIVIVAAGHYPRDFGINLTELFEVDYLKEESDEINSGTGKYWINIHRSQSKLLIHTNQLSMPSKKLISTIAEVCKKFSDDNDIQVLSETRLSFG